MKKVSLILYLFIGLGCVFQAQTVAIGGQVWMTKNLNVATFRNGDPIPQVKTDEEWEKAGQNQQPAWCYYNNDSAKGTKYGRLYNWYAVTDPRGLAPKGYHIPSNYEWKELIYFLGGESLAGKKMKSKVGWKNYITDPVQKTCPNCEFWNDEYRRKAPCHTCKDTRFIFSPQVPKSGNGSNLSGFSSLPGGGRHFFGEFGGIGELCEFWSNTPTIVYADTVEDDYIVFMEEKRGYFEMDEDGYNAALTVNLWNSAGTLFSQSRKRYGLSVRCLRD